MLDHEINKIKEKLLVKFIEYLRNGGITKECLDDVLPKLDDEMYKFDPIFYYFIGEEDVILEVYEKIDRRKFIELALSKLSKIE